MRPYCALLATLLPTVICAASAEEPYITQNELLRRTQELNDAVAPGNRAPWDRYFADDALYFDEKGRAMDKHALLADLVPLPKGYSGTIKVVKPQSRILGTTAVFTYDLDESEIIYGQKQAARYHGTDTWMFRNGRWQIVAGQMLRYYEDPAPGKVDPARLDEYVGTYRLAPGVTLTVSRQGDQLYSTRVGRKPEPLIPEALDLFFHPGAEGRRLFRRNVAGKVDALIDRRNNEDVLWTKL